MIGVETARNTGSLVLALHSLRVRAVSHPCCISAVRKTSSREYVGVVDGWRSWMMKVDEVGRGRSRAENVFLVAGRFVPRPVPRSVPPPFHFHVKFTFQALQEQNHIAVRVFSMQQSCNVPMDLPPCLLTEIPSYVGSQAAAHLSPTYKRR